MIIALVLSLSFSCMQQRWGFNELDTKPTDTARATCVRGGQGNGAEVKVTSVFEEHI